MSRPEQGEDPKADDLNQFFIYNLVVPGPQNTKNWSSSNTQGIIIWNPQKHFQTNWWEELA